MKTSRKSFYQVGLIIALVIAGLLVVHLLWQYWVRRPTLISREEAIQHAIEACNPAYGLQPVENPTEFETELTTLDKAQGFVRMPTDIKRTVWVVTMKGRWMLVGGPAPDPSNPGPFYWDECTQIIDAQTGESLSTPIE